MFLHVFIACLLSLFTFIFLFFRFSSFLVPSVRRHDSSLHHARSNVFATPSCSAPGLALQRISCGGRNDTTVFPEKNRGGRRGVDGAVEHHSPSLRIPARHTHSPPEQHAGLTTACGGEEESDRPLSCKMCRRVPAAFVEGTAVDGKGRKRIALWNG